MFHQHKKGDCTAKPIQIGPKYNSSGIFFGQKNKNKIFEIITGTLNIWTRKLYLKTYTITHWLFECNILQMWMTWWGWSLIRVCKANMGDAGLEVVFPSLILRDWDTTTKKELCILWFYLLLASFRISLQQLFTDLLGILADFPQVHLNIYYTLWSVKVHPVVSVMYDEKWQLESDIWNIT